MPEEATKIIGVDFSGAIPDQKTWICEGQLFGETLCIESCIPITRKDLTEKLSGMGGPMIAAMDFPFGLPRDFVSEKYPPAKSRAEVWSIAKDDSCKEIFEKRAKNFGGKHLRLCDVILNKKIKAAGVKSPLATSPRNMVPMTFWGMKMLHSLKGEGFRVLPDEKGPNNNGERVLMEVMPGATLRALKLRQPYKSDNTEESTRTSRKNRAEILVSLPFQSNINLCGIDQIRLYALNFDDCLDAIVAAVTAAMWHNNCKRFIIPPLKDDPKFDRVQIEGWLYAPAPSKMPA